MLRRPQFTGRRCEILLDLLNHLLRFEETSRTRKISPKYCPVGGRELPGTSGAQAGQSKSLHRCNWRKHRILCSAWSRKLMIQGEIYSCSARRHLWCR